MNPGKVPSVHTTASRCTHEAAMPYPEGEDKGSVRFAGPFVIDGRNEGEALGANGDMRLAADALARSESGGSPSSA